MSYAFFFKFTHRNINQASFAALSTYSKKHNFKVFKFTLNSFQLVFNNSLFWLNLSIATFRSSWHYENFCTVYNFEEFYFFLRFFLLRGFLLILILCYIFFFFFISNNGFWLTLFIFDFFFLLLTIFTAPFFFFFTFKL